MKKILNIAIFAFAVALFSVINVSAQETMKRTK